MEVKFNFWNRKVRAYEMPEPLWQDEPYRGAWVSIALIPKPVMKRVAAQKKYPLASYRIAQECAHPKGMLRDLTHGQAYCTGCERYIYVGIEILVPKEYLNFKLPFRLADLR